jgi:hypothetical protein
MVAAGLDPACVRREEKSQNAAQTSGITAEECCAKKSPKHWERRILKQSSQILEIC